MGRHYGQIVSMLWVPTVFLLDATERVEEAHTAAYEADVYLLSWTEPARDTE